MPSSIIDFRVRVPDDLRPAQVTPPEIADQYDAVLDVSATKTLTFADLQKEMTANDVTHAVMHAEYEFGDPADALNEALATVIAKAPQQFSGVGTISMEPLNIMRALAQLEYCKDAGMKGVSIEPSFFHRSIDDKCFYPVYAKSQELGLFVCLHTGINYGVTHPIRNDHPLLLDDVACDFPDLVLVACHAGWPWVTEMVAVARKHPNVYLEFGGLAPKYLGEAGTGWEVMYRFMNSLLAEQILFGTDWPVISQTRAASEWRALGLKPEVLEKALSKNAARLLNL